MIIDFHTHVFPPVLASTRQALLSREAPFREMYAPSGARMATAQELLASMQRAGVDVSVALGFAWRDAELCRTHNDYLLRAAAESGGSIVALCSLPLAAGRRAIEEEALRCIKAGARGFGELRPDDLAFDLAGEDGAFLAGLARELDAVLLFHTSEPVGHAYPGKRGLQLGALYEFLRRAAGVRVVAAHWGGGLPFYALMPEVRDCLENVYFDSAASSLLYTPDVYRQVASLAGEGRILFGSDFPLQSQAKSRRRLESSGLAADAVQLALGGNACRLLGLE